MSVEIRVPTLGESIVAATIATWLKREGDTVQQGDALVELETDKVNVEVTAQQDGVLQKVVKHVGDVVAVGEVLGIISANAKMDSGTAQRPPSPLAQRIAAEHDIDLSQVKAVSPHGRITKDDVIDYLEQHTQKASTPSPPPTAPSSQPVQTQQPARNGQVTIPTASPTVAQPTVTARGREERIRMSRRRQTIAQRLVEAQHTAAMLTTFNEIDMTAVMDIRSRRKDWFKEHHDVSLGYMSFFTKAVVGTLKMFPRLNAEIQDNDILLKYYYDIGIAVGTQEGLVVPVLRDADRKSFAHIEREIADLAKRAREGKLTLSELQGGTFTISNGGVYGSLLSTPILNVPQVGIVGMHKIEQRPIALNGQVVIRPMMYIALSYDHRIVDGSEAVSFLVKIKELVEDPEMLLLEG
jgi:2-oxoglutarate dehydrogenase E2 component (dihydrolipoamide succinyltransferase)